MGKEYFPLFWYGGSKRHGIPSDKPFIEARLNCLPADQRIYVSEEYTKIFVTHHNAKRYREARKEANEFLDNYVREVFHAVPEKERNDNITNQKWIQERITKVREAQKNMKPKIVLERRRYRDES